MCVMPWGRQSVAQQEILIGQYTRDTLKRLVGYSGELNVSARIITAVPILHTTGCAEVMAFKTESWMSSNVGNETRRGVRRASS